MLLTCLTNRGPSDLWPIPGDKETKFGLRPIRFDLDFRSSWFHSSLQNK